MLVCAHMCACICKRFINYVNVLACLSSCIWCRRSRTRSVVQHFIHMAAVLSWASSRVRVLWEDAPVELDHTFTITSFLCHSQYMKILTLEHHARLDIDPYLSGWGKKKKAHVTSLWADIWSDTLINICHPSSLLWGSRWWGCLLWVNGDWIDTAAKWSVLAGGWFHLPGSFFLFFFSLRSRPGWSHTANQLYLYFYFTLHWIWVFILLLQTKTW